MENKKINHMYYVARIPAEEECKHPGRSEGVVAVFCGLLSFLFFPPIFGVAGIVLGMQARHLGSRSLGMTAIVISSVLMTAGTLISIFISTGSGLGKDVAGFIFVNF
jgi:hypothetical protein